jgi:hypothetical protein
MHRIVGVCDDETRLRAAVLRQSIVERAVGGYGHYATLVVPFETHAANLRHQGRVLLEMADAAEELDRLENLGECDPLTGGRVGWIEGL